MFKVYEIDIKGKKYIGCTGSDISVRMSEHRNMTKYRNSPLYKVWRETGLFEASVTILAQFSDKQRAYSTEARLIKQTKPQLNVYLK
jgi:predicted GIY-YIG superfamily endonuclease